VLAHAGGRGAGGDPLPLAQLRAGLAGGRSPGADLSSRRRPALGRSVDADPADRAPAPALVVYRAVSHCLAYGCAAGSLAPDARAACEIRWMRHRLTSSSLAQSFDRRTFVLGAVQGGVGLLL